MNLGKIISFVLAVHACAFGVLFYSSCKKNGGNEGQATASENAQPMGTTQTASSTRVAPLALDDNQGSGTSGATLPADNSSINPPVADNLPSSQSFTTAPETYVVKRGDSLDRIARAKGVSVKEIAELNKIKDPSKLREGQSLLIPAGASVNGNGSAYVSTSSNTTKPLPGVTTYKVKSGDSLSKIAKEQGTTVTKLKAANDLKSDRLSIGQTLVIPDGTVTTVKTTATSSDTVKTTTAASPIVVSGDVYEVKSGDYLDAIAKAHGVTAKNLMEWNNISDPTKLQIGQKLVVKPNGGTGTIAGSTETNGATQSKPETTPKAEVTPPPADTTTAPILPGNDPLLPSNDATLPQDTNTTTLPPLDAESVPLNEIR